MYADATCTGHCEPVTICTVADCRRYGYGLSVFCVRCRRWADFDLARLCTLGHGHRPVATVRPRCSRCGARGEIQLRALAPAWGGYHEMQACTER